MERFDPDSITNDVLIDELKMLAKKLGKTPSRNDMVALGTDTVKSVGATCFAISIALSSKGELPIIPKRFFIS